VFPLEPDPANGVRRLAALVVAPALDEARILAILREGIDPVFLPRPLRRVAALPRNATGKLPRDALLAALRAPGA
jgi:acyl-coenzyme A synthetase/AMP-(fatty) acid ligase